MIVFDLFQGISFDILYLIFSHVQHHIVPRSQWGMSPRNGRRCTRHVRCVDCLEKPTVNVTFSASQSVVKKAPSHGLRLPLA